MYFTITASIETSTGIIRPEARLTTEDGIEMVKRSIVETYAAKGDTVTYQVTKA